MLFPLLPPQVPLNLMSGSVCPAKWLWELVCLWWGPSYVLKEQPHLPARSVSSGLIFSDPKVTHKKYLDVLFPSHQASPSVCLSSEHVVMFLYSALSTTRGPPCSEDPWEVKWLVSSMGSWGSGPRSAAVQFKLRASSWNG